MYLSPERLKFLCRKRGLRLKSLLERSKVSRTAYYSLLQKETVLPQSILKIARVLGVQPSAFLEEENREEKKLENLRKIVERIVALNPGIDRENVWHTLRLRELPPIERLKRSLLRAQKIDIHQ